MLTLLFATAAFLAVVWVTWTAQPGPVLRRIARVIGLLFIILFWGSLLPTSKANAVSIYVMGLAWYIGLGLTRWRRKRKGTWPTERTQRWPGWFVLSVAYLMYIAVATVALSRRDYGPVLVIGMAFYVVVLVLILSRAKGWRQPWTREGREEVTSTAQRQLDQMRRYSADQTTDQTDKQ